MELLHAIGISQAMLLATYFFRKRKAPGNIYEAILLFCLALTISSGYLYGTHEILEYPHLSRLGFTFMSILGPLFYLSQRSRELSSNRIQWKDIVFFLVPIGITVYLIPFHSSTREEKLIYLREDLVKVHFDCVVILYASLANNLSAFIVSLWRTYVHSAKSISSGRNQIEKDSSLPLQVENRNLLRGSLVFHLVPILFLVGATGASLFDENLLNSGLFSGVSSLLILARSYLLIYSHDSSQTEIVYPAIVKYQKAFLSEAFVKQTGERIQLLLEDEKPFLEPDFSLAELTQRMNLSTFQCSQIINRHFQKSFLALLQQHRVEEAKILLSSRPSSFTILDIALESGFNSKSSFNSIFKKATGKTPRDWRASKSRTTDQIIAAE